MKVAIIGTMGVPAKYGGFESLVENLIVNKHNPDIQYTVYCSGKDYQKHVETYNGASLKYVNWFHANGSQSIPYDVISMLRSVSGYDVVLVLGVSGCVFLPFFRLLSRSRIIVNIDGLEHRRAKWGRFVKWFLRKSESMAVRFSDVIVSDNKAIQDYVTGTYHKHSALIAYGGDHVERNVEVVKESEILSKYGVTSGTYAISVCRIEPENNSEMICQSFAKTGEKLLFIGNWDHSEYGSRLKAEYGKIPTMSILDPVYDLDELYVLRKNSCRYIHGHSAGGTNPSLVEAMFFGKMILAYDVPYNRETTGGLASYFKTEDDLSELLEKPYKEGTPLRNYAHQHYTWAEISRQYEQLYTRALTK